MDSVAELIVKAVDAAWADNQKSGHRYHLGASIVGRKCAREVWYKFHWWHAVRHTGRLLRLFHRGHREEDHVVECLRRLGATVQNVDQHGKQTKFTNLWGLFGGERDGAIGGLEHLGLEGQGLLEIKTHGEKSFKTLVSKGLLSSKPEHVIQMQMYMRWSDLPWALYWAVNKNNDEVYVEIIYRREVVSGHYTNRALEIIRDRLPPPRISNDPSWFACKFCDFKRHCHEDADPDKNCRTCTHVTLRLDGDPDTGTHAWVCGKYGQDIPKDFTRQGCDQWVPRDTD